MGLSFNENYMKWLISRYVPNISACAVSQMTYHHYVLVTLYFIDYELSAQYTLQTDTIGPAQMLHASVLSYKLG